MKKKMRGETVTTLSKGTWPWWHIDKEIWWNSESEDWWYVDETADFCGPHCSKEQAQKALFRYRKQTCLINMLK